MNSVFSCSNSNIYLQWLRFRYRRKTWSLENLIWSADVLLDSALFRFLILPHPLINNQAQKCYKKGPSFKGDYSRDNIPNILEDGENGVKSDKYLRKVTYYVVCYLHGDSFIIIVINGVELINDEVKPCRSNVIENEFWIYSNGSVMYRCFFIVFTNYMPARKRLTD